MLPDDPLLRGRLFRAARGLLGWGQARLACEVGASTSAVNAVETGRIGKGGTVLAMRDALERGGVRFLPAAADAALGEGVRYANPPRGRAGARVVRLPRPGGGAAGAGAAPCRVASAERCLARQRALLARLAAAGHASLAGGELLAAMERSLELLRGGRGPVGPPPAADDSAASAARAA